MFDLYFGNIPTIISTVLVIGIWIYIIRSIRKENKLIIGEDISLLAHKNNNIMVRC